jgi:hypothetical protein
MFTVFFISDDADSAEQSSNTNNWANLDISAKLGFIVSLGTQRKGLKKNIETENSHATVPLNLLASWRQHRPKSIRHRKCALAPSWNKGLYACSELQRTPPRQAPSSLSQNLSGNNTLQNQHLYLQKSNFQEAR